MSREKKQIGSGGQETVHDRLRGVFCDYTYSEITQAMNGVDGFQTSPETVRRCLNGQRLSVPFVMAIAECKGVRVQWLLTGQGERTESLERDRILENAPRWVLHEAIARRLKRQESSSTTPDQR